MLDRGAKQSIHGHMKLRIMPFNFVLWNFIWNLLVSVCYIFLQLYQGILSANFYCFKIHSSIVCLVLSIARRELDNELLRAKFLDCANVSGEFFIHGTGCSDVDNSHMETWLFLLLPGLTGGIQLWTLLFWFLKTEFDTMSRSIF